MVLLNSCRISRAPQYLGAHWVSAQLFGYETVTLFGWPFLANSPKFEPFFSPDSLYQIPRESLDPLNATSTVFLTFKVWALPFSLAATRGITFVFFSSGY